MSRTFAHHHLTHATVDVTSHPGGRLVITVAGPLLERIVIEIDRGELRLRHATQAEPAAGRQDTGCAHNDHRCEMLNAVCIVDCPPEPAGGEQDG